MGVGSEVTQHLIGAPRRAACNRPPSDDGKADGQNSATAWVERALGVGRQSGAFRKASPPSVPPRISHETPRRALLGGGRNHTPGQPPHECSPSTDRPHYH